MNRELGQEIFSYLSEAKEDMVSLLRDLVTIESPSSEPDSQAAILSLLLEQFQALSYQVQLVPGTHTGGHILAQSADLNSAQCQQLLLGHCDTVWPIGTLKSMPFSFENGKIKGPGVFDMKGGLVQMIFALRVLRALDLRPVVAPVILINSDEEIGSIESGSSIQDVAKRVDRAFVLEPALGLEGKLKTTRKGVGRFQLTINGRAAHAGLDPLNGISAILELSYIIQKLFAMNDLSRGISVNVGLVEGGIRPNVIAPRSSAQIDVRVPSIVDADKIQTEIRSLVTETPGTSLEISGQFTRKPMERTSANRQLWAEAQRQSNFLAIKLDEGMAGGGSDGNTTSLYTATIDGLGAVGDGAHAHHEFLFVDKMVERCALLAALLLSSPLSACSQHR